MDMDFVGSTTKPQTSEKLDRLKNGRKLATADQPQFGVTDPSIKAYRNSSTNFEIAGLEETLEEAHIHNAQLEVRLSPVLNVCTLS